VVQQGIRFGKFRNLGAFRKFSKREELWRTYPMKLSLKTTSCVICVILSCFRRKTPFLASWTPMSLGEHAPSLVDSQWALKIVACDEPSHDFISWINGMLGLSKILGGKKTETCPCGVQSSLKKIEKQSPSKTAVNYSSIVFGGYYGLLWRLQTTNY